MTTVSNALLAMAVGVSLTALASPSFAQSHHDRAFDARAAALQLCSDLERKFPENTWGENSSAQYRACMARYGQPE